mgnify:CR=1 FL=1
MYTNFLLFFVTTCFFLIYFCRKNNLILDYKLESHKRFSSKLKSNSIGGIFLIIFLFYEYVLINQNINLFLILFSIFLIGFLSDIKKLNSVSLRFFLQLILILSFVNIIGLEIKNTRIYFLDTIIANKIVNIIFVSFCLMVLINGSNFIDGLNGLLLKYNLIIYLVIFFSFNQATYVETNFIVNLISILFVILLFNLFGLIYMGDSGAYLLSLFSGIYLINFSFYNQDITPFFIILLLWYPCFELLFSMIRRFINKSKTYKPDTSHLHQLIYYFIKKNLKFKDTVIHFFTSLLINSFNLLVFIFAANFVYSSKIIVFTVIANMCIYISLYVLLKKKYQMDN